MSLYPTLRVLLIALLSSMPSGAAEPGEEGPDETVAVHRHFDSVKPFIEEPNQDTERAVWEHCQVLDRRCLAFAQANGELVLSTVPDNPDFWLAYEALLAAAPLPVELVEAGELPAYQGFINSVNGWVRRELVVRHLSDAQRLHAQVSAHRRRLGLSNILIDKMIFTASTGNLLPAINVYMAQRTGQELSAADRLLDSMLQRLSLDEMSLRRSMDGELRYAAARMEELPAEDAPVRLEDLERVYDFVAERSEAEWDDFWRNGLDISTGVGLLPSESELYPPSLASYALNLRNLDVSLIVLREMRELYEGRVSPGPPAAEAPYGWNWRWDEGLQTLCLDRGYVHASLSVDGPVSICHPYLSADSSRRP